MRLVDHPEQGAHPDPLQAGDHRQRPRQVNLAVFVLAAIVTRGIQFFLVAGLLRQFGTPVRTFIEKRLTLATTGLAVMIVLGFAMLHYL